MKLLSERIAVVPFTLFLLGDKQIITNQISRFHPQEKEEQEDLQEEEDEDEPEAEESEAEPSHGAYHYRHKSQLPSGYEGR